MHYRRKDLKLGSSCIFLFLESEGTEKLTDRKRHQKMKSRTNQNAIAEAVVVGIHLRLPDPVKRNGGQAQGLFISGIMVPVSEDDAPVVVIGKELSLPMSNRHTNRSIQPNFSLHSVMGIVGTPPIDNMWHTPPGNTCHTPCYDTWHALSSGSPSSGFPQEYTWRAFPIRTPSRRGTRHSQI